MAYINIDTTKFADRFDGFTREVIMGFSDQGVSITIKWYAAPIADETWRLTSTAELDMERKYVAFCRSRHGRARKWWPY